MRLTLILLAACLLISGCSSSGDSVDDDDRSWARQIRFIEPNHMGERRYEELAGLEEDAPVTPGGEDAAIDRAKERMRQRAAKVDADAVVMIGCDRVVDPMDPSIQSTSTIRCQGIAIRWIVP